VQDTGALMTLIGNNVAGAIGAAFTSFGFAVPPERFLNNSAHSSNLCWAAKGGVTQPIKDLTCWRIRTAAIWGFSGSDRPVVSNVRVADSAVADGRGARTSVQLARRRSDTIDDRTVRTSC